MRGMKVRFKITDIGSLKYFLRIRSKASEDKKRMNLTQETYTERVIERFVMSDARAMKTKMVIDFLNNSALGPREKRERETVSNFRALIGSLIYLA